MPGRVLVVAYYFPPVGGVGVQRTLKYVTYLPRWGWQPVVLTASNPVVAERDDEAARGLPPGLVIERAFAPEPAKLRRALGRAARGVMSLRPARSEPGPGGVSTRTPDAVAAPGEGARSVRGYGGLAAAWTEMERLLFFPEPEVNWAPFAVRRGVDVHRRSPVDAIYSSSGPVTCHIVAERLARRTKLPWVADFRDPWIGNAFAAPVPWLHRSRQARIERRIVERADRVVFATAGLADAYSARYPWAADRFHVIYNGYDRADFASAPGSGPQPQTGAARFRITYAGSIYGDHELSIFLDGLETLFDRRPDLREELEVEFVGWLNLHNQAVAAQYATPDRLGSVLRFTGFVPHSEALEHLLAADAVLQIIGDGPGRSAVVVGKLAEYVGLDRQILAVVPEGDARMMLRELDWGIIADPTPAGVAEGVERLLATPAPNRRADPEGRFDRVNLTGQLAGILDGVARASGVASSATSDGPDQYRAKP
jgi:glycosyltransferase involved in cell wall biosynthesis